MGRRIIVDVAPDGTLNARTQGYRGPACLKEVEHIEALCGEKIASSKLTDEYYMESVATNHSEDVGIDLGLEENFG